MSGIQEDGEFKSEISESYQLDPSSIYGRYGSLSSLRLSGQISRRSSVRDEVQTLDEFLRKQRVIRYMENERERAARAKILRDEHNKWIEIRAIERLERLKYLNEQEIEELLRREAEEALREKAAAEASAKRDAEEAIRSRRSLAVLREKEDESSAAIKTRVKEPDNSSQKQVSLAEIEDTRRICLELRLREEELIAECKRLKGELSEAAEKANRAVRDCERTEKELAKERKKASGQDINADLQVQLQKQVELLKKQLADLHAKLALTETDRKRLSSLVEERDLVFGSSQVQLDALSVEKRKENPLLNQHMQENVISYNERENDEPKQMRKTAEESKRKLMLLQKEIAAKDKEIDQYRKQLSFDQKRSGVNTKNSFYRNNESSKIDREMYEKAEQEIMRLKKSMEKMRTDLELANQEKKNLQKNLDDLKEKAQNAMGVADQETVISLKKKVLNLLTDARKDTSAIQCLKNELHAVQEELKYEVATRSKFEELAAQAIDRNDNAPKADVLKLQQKLQESELKLQKARAEVDETRRKAQEEVLELKNWCTRLKERQDTQMRDMELVLQNISEDQQRNPQTEKTTTIPELRAQKATGKYMKVKLQTSVNTSDKQDNEAREGKMPGLKGQETSSETITSAYLHDQATQMQLALIVERLERENAELRQKYDLGQQYNDVGPKRSIEVGKTEFETESSLQVEKTVQADVIVDKESVSSNRANAPNANGTRLEGHVVNQTAILADKMEIGETAEKNVDELRTRALDLSNAQTVGSAEKKEKECVFSKDADMNHTPPSATQQSNHRKKTKCGCC